MALIDKVKLRLGYLETDQATDDMIKDLIQEGETFLDAFCPDLDYSSPSKERTLLIEWIRYALANATDDFRKNYRDELIALSNRGRVLRYAEQKKTSQ